MGQNFTKLDNKGITFLYLFDTRRGRPLDADPPNANSKTDTDDTHPINDIGDNMVNLISRPGQSQGLLYKQLRH